MVTIIIKCASTFLGIGPIRTVRIKPEWPDKVGETFVASINEEEP